MMCSDPVALLCVSKETQQILSSFLIALNFVSYEWKLGRRLCHITSQLLKFIRWFRSAHLITRQLWVSLQIQTLLPALSFCKRRH